MKALLYFRSSKLAIGALAGVFLVMKLPVAEAGSTKTKQTVVNPSIIQVFCNYDLYDANTKTEIPNMKLNKLSPIEASFSAKALEESYGKVESQLASKDFQHILVHTQWRGNVESGTGGIQGTYTSDWICLECEFNDSDNNRYLSRFEQEMSNDDPWATAFVDLLKKGPFDVFSGINNCEIVLVPIPSKGTPQAGEILPVKLQVACDHWDLSSSLSMEGDVLFVASALESTYNVVHREIDGNFLQKVAPPSAENATVVNHIRRPQDFTRKGYWFQGDWFHRVVAVAASGSKMMIEGKDSQESLAPVPELHKAWESLFLSRLVTAPGKTISLAKNCTIEIQLQGTD